jgi:hypothetical protein
MILFPGQVLRTCENVRTWAVPACGVRSCGVRGWRDPGQRRGCGGSVPDAAGGLCPFVGCCSWVGVWEACRHGVFQLCGVRYAWTLGLVRRLVDLSGLLLRWLSGILLLLRGGRVGCGNVPDNAYDQGGQELGVSADGCRVRSLACARFTPLPAPPAGLSATLPDVFLAFVRFEFYLR